MANMKPATKPSQRRLDWDAVERDYRTGQFTFRELESRHGGTATTICRHAKQFGWKKDLREAIKQATDAALLQDTVTKAQQSVTETVLAVAEVNKQIVLSHRARLASLFEDVDTAKATLVCLGQQVSDIREAATYVQAVGNLVTATKNLIEQERKAFNLDGPQPEEPANRGIGVTSDSLARAKQAFADLAAKDREAVTSVGTSSRA